jgi:hypothetical protein
VWRGTAALVFIGFSSGTLIFGTSLAAALLQATSLSFLVAASQIGLALNLLSLATSAALIAAGLLSVLVFPLTALTLLRGIDLPAMVAVPQAIPADPPVWHHQLLDPDGTTGPAARPQARPLGNREPVVPGQ